MKSLTNFIATLPGVRPRKARALILDGEVLSKAERADIRAFFTDVLGREAIDLSQQTHPAELTGAIVMWAVALSPMH